MYITDYSTLRSFNKINILKKLDKVLLSELKKNNLEDTCKVIISLSMMNINWIKAYKLFTSNRYFVDCLKIKLFPEINKFLYSLQVSSTISFTWP